MLTAYWTVLGWPFPSDMFPDQVTRMEGSGSWHFMGFLGFGLAIGGVAGVVAELRKPGKWAPAALAMVAVGIESLTFFLLPAQLGVTQYRSAFMAGAASLVGLTGVSLLVWWSNLALAMSLGRPAGEPGPRWLNHTAVAGLAIVSWVTLAPVPGTKGELPGPGKVRVAALQTRDTVTEELLADQRLKDVWLNVWPELSGIPWVRGGSTQNLTDYAQAHGARFATSFQDAHRPKPYNALSIFGPEGESERYHKRRLFGGEAQMHEPGTKAVVVEVSGVTIGLNVCFDSCYPSLIGETAALGADLIVLPSMGPESPHGFVQAVHGAYTVFRSAEFGVPIVRGETSAFASISDTNGRLLALAPPGFQGAIAADVPIGQRWTLYKLTGEWVQPACIAGTLFWVVLALRNSRNQSKMRLESTEPSGSTS